MDRLKITIVKSIKDIVHFAAREAVLTAAIILAVISAFFVPPDVNYLEYPDWNTLSLLFSLMAVVAALKKAGVFQYLGSSLLKHTADSRIMILILTLLPFVFSMVITNDVALITFVPFALTVLRISGQENLAVKVVIQQTLAANLGSMLTPMGNPQNLYLYNKFSLTFGQLFHTMLPYVSVSFVCLAAASLVGKGRKVTPAAETEPVSKRELAWGIPGAVVCLFGIFKIIPAPVIAVVFAVFLVLRDRKLLASIDYSLLLTFLAFFIFIGNMERIGEFREFISWILAGHEQTAAILASQIISNVPAVFLLSGFTQNWQGLLVGCNIGGLGTLIASMASLISYKHMVKAYPQQNRRYLLWFTVGNIAMLAALIGLYLLKSL